MELNNKSSAEDTLLNTQCKNQENFKDQTTAIQNVVHRLEESLNCIGNGSFKSTNENALGHKGPAEVNCSTEFQSTSSNNDAAERSVITSPDFSKLCIVCTGEAEVISTIDEDIVVYFVEKFLPSSLLCSFNNEDTLSNVITIELINNRLGSPSTWISFCPPCLQLVQEARKLFLEILELESKLMNIRHSVTSTVTESQNTMKTRENSGINNQSWDKSAKSATDKPCCFTQFRNYIINMGMEKPIDAKVGEILPSALVEVKVKSEYPSDIEDFADTEIEWIAEDIGIRKLEESLSPSSNSFQLKDIIIDPLQSFEEHEERAANPKRKNKGAKDGLEESIPMLSDEDLELVEGLTLLKQETYSKTKRQSRTSQVGRYKRLYSDLEFKTSEAEDLEQSGSGNATNDELPIHTESDEELETKPSGRRCRPKTTNGKKRQKDYKNKRKAAAAALSIEIKDHRGMGKCTVESKTCPVCKRVFLNPSKMAVHYNIKHDRKILFNCDVCSRGFMRKDYLREHMKIHLSPEEKMVERVRKESGVRKSKEKAKPKITEDTGNQASCPICKTSFEDTAHLQRHVNYFHGKTEGYTCEVCDKKFQWKDALRKHMRLHEGTKKFKCDYEGCESAFYYKKHLEVHQRIHTGAKDFLCALCGISFRHEWSFNRHNIFKHHKVTSKTYLCETCGKSFKIKSHLDQHLQSKSHGGTGLKRRKRSRAKINMPSSKNSSNEKDGQAVVPMVSSTVKTKSTALPAINQPTSHTALPPASQIAAYIPTLVLAANINYSPPPSGLQSRLQSEGDRSLNFNRLPAALQGMERTETRPTISVPATCNGIQAPIASTSSKDNEYLRYIAGMANSGTYSQTISSLSLNFQLQSNSSTTQNVQQPHANESLESLEEHSPASICEPLPIVSEIEPQISSSIISHNYQNNYSNAFNFVVTSSPNGQQNVLMQQNPQQ